MPEPTERREYIISGEQTVHDWDLIVGALGDVGLKADRIEDIKPAADPIESLDEIYEKILSGITTSTDFVGREHALSFIRRHAPEHESAVTNTLHSLMNPGLVGRDGLTQYVDPATIGLVVKSREELGADKWTTLFNQSGRYYRGRVDFTHMIQIGSLISFFESYGKGGIKLYQFGEAASSFTEAFVEYLRQRIETTAEAAISYT